MFPAAAAPTNDREESMMCPACLTTLAWLTIGTTSAGSATALAMNRHRRVDRNDDKRTIKKETRL